MTVLPGWPLILVVAQKYRTSPHPAPPSGDGSQRPVFSVVPSPVCTALHSHLQGVVSLPELQLLAEALNTCSALVPRVTCWESSTDFLTLPRFLDYVPSMLVEKDKTSGELPASHMPAFAHNIGMLQDAAGIELHDQQNLQGRTTHTQVALRLHLYFGKNVPPVDKLNLWMHRI